MSFGKRWQLGLRIFVNLVIILLFSHLMLFIAVGPAGVLVWVAQTEEGVLAVVLRVIAFGYLVALSPWVLAWLAARGGLPGWGTLPSSGGAASEEPTPTNPASEVR